MEGFRWRRLYVPFGTTCCTPFCLLAALVRLVDGCKLKFSLDEEEFIAPIGSMKLNRAIIVSALLVDSKHVDNES